MSTSSSWTWTIPGPFGRPCVVASLDKTVRRRKKSPRKSGSKGSPVRPEIRNVSVNPWFQNPRKNAENGEKWKNLLLDDVSIVPVEKQTTFHFYRNQYLNTQIKRKTLIREKSVLEPFLNTITFQRKSPKYGWNWKSGILWPKTDF